MKGLIFLGLLACVHGLGDEQPYTNTMDVLLTTAGQAVVGSWGDQCITGTRQSPIDIVTTAAVVQKPDVGAIMSTGFEVDKAAAWRVNGNNAGGAGGKEAFLTAVEVTTDTPAFITGGPLDASYRFSHVEFHWPPTATGLGSEHSIDGVRAAMEIQFVHFKTQFSAAKEAAAAADTNTYTRAVTLATAAPVDPAGIAVIAYQVDVGAQNAELLPITADITAKVTAAVAGTTAAGSTPAYTTGLATAGTPAAATNVNMSALMMLDNGMLDDYYYYDGSLTLPSGVAGIGLGVSPTTSCAETVRWIIPTQRLTLSAAQLAVFHTQGTRTSFGMVVTGATGHANSRLIQTGARIAGITLNRRVPTVVKDNAVWRNLAGTLLSVGTFGLVHNLLTQDETAKALTENPVVDILQDIEQRFARPAPQERQSFNHHHHPQDIQY